MRHIRARTHKVLVVSSRWCGDTTPSRVSREPLRAHRQESVCPAIAWLARPRVDEFIEGLGYRCKRNSVSIPELKVNQTFPNHFPLVAFLDGTTKLFAVTDLTLEG